MVTLQLVVKISAFSYFRFLSTNHLWLGVWVFQPHSPSIITVSSRTRRRARDPLPMGAPSSYVSPSQCMRKGSLWSSLVKKLENTWKDRESECVFRTPSTYLSLCFFQSANTSESFHHELVLYH